MRNKKLLRVLSLLMISILILSCAPSPASDLNELPATQSEQPIVQVDWVQINPPPGVEGPCYAYFIDTEEGHWAVGYSGVWCK